jgi:hypothetical protein
MPILVRGVAVCDKCGKSASLEAVYGNFNNDISLRWQLPKDWFGKSRGKSSAIIYCGCPGTGMSSAMELHAPSSQPLNQSSAVDTRAIVKLIELAETKGARSDDILNAISAVLVAWQAETAKTP